MLLCFVATSDQIIGECAFFNRFPVSPNEKLKPKFTNNFEIGLTKRFSNKAQISAIAFYTILKNGISRRYFTHLDQDSIIYDGVLSKVQAEVNVGEASIYGFSVNFQSDVSTIFLSDHP